MQNMNEPTEISKATLNSHIPAAVSAKLFTFPALIPLYTSLSLKLPWMDLYYLHLSDPEETEWLRKSNTDFKTILFPTTLYLSQQSYLNSQQFFHLTICST